MRTLVRTFLFKNFGRRLDSAAVISTLGVACSDLRRSNDNLARAFRDRDASPQKPRWRGDATYALRMLIGHFNEALSIIPLIERDPYLMSLLASADDLTRNHFEHFRRNPKQKGSLLVRLRNNTAFHYQNIRLFKSAILKRITSQTYDHSKMERAEEMRGWHEKFADDLMETILAMGAGGQLSGNEGVLLSDDAIGKEIGSISADAATFLSFSGELMWLFVGAEGR